MPAADPARRPHDPAERRGGGTTGFADLRKKRIFGHVTSKLSKDTTPNMLGLIECIKNLTNPLIGLRDYRGLVRIIAKNVLFWIAACCFTKECGLDLSDKYWAMVKNGWGQPEMGVADQKW